MLTLTRARASKGNAGEPLPTVFNKFASNTVHIRQGQLTLIAAAPGVGKSLLSLSLAMRAGVPAFYFSADTDAFTMYIRAAAMIAGWSTHDVETAVERGLHDTIDAQLNSLHHVRFSFDASPSIDDIEEELQAYAMVYGEFPALVVVDNLRNVYSPDDTENMDRLCDYMHELARETGAGVVGLHHVKGAYNDGRTPIPLSGLMGQIGKVPELIMTLYKSGIAADGGAEWLNVCPVKNRTGKAEADGSWSLPLAAEFDRMKLEG